MSIDDVTQWMNVVAFALFVVLLGLAVGRMIVRILFYRKIRRRPSVILRRDLVLLGGLLIVFGISQVIRAGGWNVVFQAGWPRFIFVAVSDVVGLSAIAYWTWIEYRIVGKPGHEND